MPKSATTAMATALTDGSALCLLIRFDFDAGGQYWTTAGRDISWDSHTWVALGGAVSIDEIRESIADEAVGLRFSLAGLSPSQVSLALQEPTHGRTCYVYLAAVVDGEVVADPFVEFAGYLDSPVGEIDPQSNQSVISITCESRRMRWGKPVNAYYTDADHQMRFPGDKFFEAMPSIADEVIVWPRKEFWL